MQQTSKYKLNLIETSDRFSPDPLNENAEKLETQLAAETQARTAADTAEARARADADAAEAKARADADTAEANARKSAITAEAKTRADAIAAEAKARADADTAETNARKAAITAETKARTDAIAAEAKARADADTAETSARKSADTTETNARKAADTALDTRVKALEAHKAAWGSYGGNDKDNRAINVGFAPSVVLICAMYTHDSSIIMAVTGTTSAYITFTSTGFQVKSTYNSSNARFMYLAMC